MSSFNCSDSTLTAPQTLSPARIDLLAALYVMLMLFSVLLPIVFRVAKSSSRNLERLRVRQTALVALAGIAGLLHAQAGPGFYVFGRFSFPCWVRSLLSMLVLPLFCANLLIKLLTFYFLSELNRAMIDVDRVDDDAFQQPSPHAARTSSAQGGAWCHNLHNLARAMLGVFSAPQRADEKTADENRQQVVALAFITSRKGTLSITLLFCAVATVLAVAVLLSRPEAVNGCTGCYLAMAEVAEIAVLACLQIAYLVVCSVRVWRFPDPWGMRSEVFACLAFAVLVFVGFLGGALLDDDSITGPTYDSQLLICVGFVLMLWTQTVWQVYKAWSSSSSTAAAARERRRRIRNESTTTSTATATAAALTLDAVMKNSKLLVAFEEFLIAELSVESLMFFKDTDEWIRAYHSIAPSARLARAKRLFNVYLGPNAPFEINVSYLRAQEVRGAFAAAAGEGGDVSIEVFNAARRDIADLLQFGPLMRFQHTTQYKDAMTQDLGRFSNLMF